MKKRNLILYGIFVIFVFTLLLLLINNKNNTFTSDGVTYALTVDGVSQNMFPAKGLYRVDTICTNATCKWDYEAWKLYIEEIIGNVKCDISFTTISETNLNDTIMGLATITPNQGNGSIIHEMAAIPDYTSVTALTQSQYGTISQYYNTSYSSTSGTSLTNAFSFSGTEWISQPSNLTSNKYYHINFTIPSDGYYQFCYELSVGNSNNQLYLYKDGDSFIINNSMYISASIGVVNSGCVDLGKVMSGTQYRVVQRAYNTISTIKFSVRKGNTKMVDAGYRYEGQDPNNYVWFNNELWRIIGVFDSTSHGVANTNLIKIIRNEPIGGLVWDKSYTNNWNISSLKELLNTEYLNSANGTSGDNCYGYSTSTKVKCDYRETGIKDTYRSMIEDVIWYLGGYSNSNIAVESMFGYERDTTSKYESNESSYNGKIGLMYASDYGFAVPAINCARATYLSKYNTADCTLNNWLYGKGREWTINHYTNTSNSVYDIRSEGFVYGNGTISGQTTRPVLYLKESVYVLDGDGSITDPYIIAMD